MKTYRIRDWDKHYETAETRKLVQLRWLPIPNKHDGLGFRRITAQPDAAELFTAWILILQVASKGRGPDERGNLLRGQEALGDEDLAMMTGFPKAIFTRALDFFSSPKQGWLIAHEDELPLSPVIPAESPVSPAPSPAVWNGMEGRDRKGIPSADSGASDVLFDALARAEGSDPAQLTKPATAKIKVALGHIRKASPTVTPEDIDARAVRYRKVMPQGTTLTANALAKHWARCGPPMPIADNPAALDGPPGWRDTLVRLFPDSTYDGPWTALAESVREQIA